MRTALIALINNPAAAVMLSTKRKGLVSSCSIVLLQLAARLSGPSPTCPLQRIDPNGIRFSLGGPPQLMPVMPFGKPALRAVTLEGPVMKASNGSWVVTPPASSTRSKPAAASQMFSSPS